MSTQELDKKKQALRRAAYTARAAQPEKETHSHKICDTFFELSDYQQADTIMLYLDCRTEVQTTQFVLQQLSGEKRIVIPYCTQDEQGDNKLGLWHLESLDELVPGMWNILEPPKDRWNEAGKEVDPQSIDLIMVPGVAFDPQGGRLGNGGGYYDRLLCSVASDTMLIGVGFASQIFDQIPMDKYDIYLDRIITENSTFQGRGRTA